MEKGFLSDTLCALTFRFLLKNGWPYLPCAPFRELRGCPTCYSGMTLPHQNGGATKLSTVISQKPLPHQLTLLASPRALFRGGNWGKEIGRAHFSLFFLFYFYPKSTFSVRGNRYGEEKKNNSPPLRIGHFPPPP